MKRLYYLTDNVDVAKRMSDRLHHEGITDWNFHVLGRNKAQIVRHHLHSTTPLQELDIVRSGGRGVLIGFVTGILLTGYVALFTSFGEQLNWMGQLASIVLFSMFGAWVGGLAGMSSENYKIRRFHRDIVKGNLLLLVDVVPSQVAAVENIVMQFPEVRKGGEDTTFINPFAKPLVH
jgi:hypothetical protein